MRKEIGMTSLHWMVLFIVCLPALINAQESRQLSIGKPLATIDLRSAEHAELVNARWYYRPTEIRPASFREPGPSASDSLWLYPTGKVNGTHRLYPQIHDEDFRTLSRWTPLPASALETRLGKGLFSHVWYRVQLKLPEQLGIHSTRQKKLVFEVVVDDYSEIWVNGQQHFAIGQHGNGVISGYNTRNRIVLSESANAGDTFDIAILAINGPLGQLPDNYVWVRQAFLDVYDMKDIHPIRKPVGSVLEIDAQMQSVIEPGSSVEQVAEGFQFTEGPVWHPNGYLLFSDPNANVIYRFDPNTDQVYLHTSHSGYSGTDIHEYSQPGSNGLAIDSEGRLIACEHGNRRIVRYEKKGPLTVLASTYQGKRFNSPNDIVLHSSGDIYFTDPPYGLPGFYDDARKELKSQGIYRIHQGQVELASDALGGPNGLAFSPDEKFLYVGNWDIRDIRTSKTVTRFEVGPDGRLSHPTLFHSFADIEIDEAIDGVKVDSAGNVYVSAPGGVYVLSPSGKRLGLIKTPTRPANMAWAGSDRRTLYMTAHDKLYMLRVKIPGSGR